MARFLGLHLRYVSMICVIVVVLLCAGLAASATNNLITGQTLDSDLAPGQDSLALPVPPASPPASRSKSRESLVERNIFCAGCAPAAATTVATAVTPGEPDGIPFTALPIELLATSVARDARLSFATLRNSQTSHQGAFYAGDAIPGAGPVERIAGTYVVFHNDATQRAEKVALLPAAVAQPAAPAAETTAGASYSESVKQTGDGSYEVDRDIVTAVMANPMQIGARVTPVQENGKITGIRLVSVRSGSPLTAIGLERGDTIQTINGYELTSPDKMLDAYQKLQTADNLTVVLQRKGQSVELRYQIR